MKDVAGMDYMRSIRFVFESPNWFLNLLYLALCFLSTTVIPVVGQLVVQRYQFEVIESLHLRRDVRYPDFDFNRIAEYLMRGLWVFLVTLVVVLVLMPVALAVAVLLMMLIAVGGEDGAGVAMFFVVLLAIAFACVFAIVANMILVPFTLRAGLTQEFGKAFDVPFAKQFIANTWQEMIVAGLFFIAAIMVLEIIGLMMFCVGIFLTMSLAMLMQAHIMLQLYRLHLARGGDAIPPKSATAVT